MLLCHIFEDYIYIVKDIDVCMKYNKALAHVHVISNFTYQIII